MNNSNKRLSLQVTISILFITLTMSLGAILSLQNYSKTSDILFASANQIYEKINEELILDIRSTYTPLAGILQMLSISPLTTAISFDERLEQLETISIALKNNPAAASLQIAYPDGGYFIVRSAASDYIRKKFKAPGNTSFIADNVETNIYGKRTLTRYFFNSKLEIIARNPQEETDYDPRNRSWYIEATNEPVATKPYVFYFTRQVGITAKIRSKVPGVVVATDLTLEELSNTINKYQVTPGTEAVLISADGRAFAYKNPGRVIISNKNDELKLANMKQLGSDVLAHLGQDIEAIEQDLNFEFNDRQWTGVTKIIGKPGGVDLFAIIISPVDELLSEASKIRLQSFIITIFTTILFIPVIWFVARHISTPLRKLANEAVSISRFEFDEPIEIRTHIKEVAELSTSMDLMKSTINRFIKLIKSLADEQNLDALLHGISRETMEISKADGVLTYLMNDADDALTPGVMCSHGQFNIATDTLPDIALKNDNELTTAASKNISSVFVIDKRSDGQLLPILELLDTDALTTIALPLSNRQNEIIGMLCLLYTHTDNLTNESESTNLSFIQALSGFAAVTLESRQLLYMQEALLSSFIKLIAGAIDSKSPYTGGHCQRVPEITFMLAKAACESDDEPFKDFDLDSKEWEALKIASWLHDCGKVTTPEYVVDKATKLETIYDRIHEIRMRFEVLKRDAVIHYWQQLAEGDNEVQLKTQLEQTLQQLDEDFAFIAECNEGGEFMAEDKIDRLHEISERTWERTLDNRVGISWEEANRMQRTEKQPLPVTEQLLADKPEHIIEREDHERMSEDNPWGFKLDVPEYQYNRGELYNLSVSRGTLSAEERYKINDHMTQTIIMLEKLPYPKHLRDVPGIAGGHHETMDGKGYPKRLTKDDMSLTARMMAIADIFEALTASDRPYKKAKTLSEAICIMGFMRNDNHIDSDLFSLFLTSGVYLSYAEQFLEPEQIDDVNINEYLDKPT